jgi:hypothetical protein
MHRNDPTTLRPLDERPLERLLDATNDHFWLLRGAPSTLWQLSKDGKGQRAIFTLPRDAVPPLCTHAFSPNCKRLALGLAMRESFFRFRDLVVVDLETGKSMFHSKRIPVQVSIISSFTPRLAVRWLDDGRLEYSETKFTNEQDGEGFFQWVEVNVSTGKRLGEKPYTKRLGLQHGMARPEDPRAPRQPRTKEGLFDWEGGALFFRGENRPLSAGVKNAEVWSAQVSPDGRWAALKFLADGRRTSFLLLADGQAKTTYRVVESVSDATWLPAK